MNLITLAYWLLIIENYIDGGDNDDNINKRNNTNRCNNIENDYDIEKAVIMIIGMTMRMMMMTI